VEDGQKDVCLCVLCVCVCVCSAMPGVTEHGAQYQLHSLYEHKLQRTAFNFCWGPFGGVKGTVKRTVIELLF